jgi:hypothetical protein
VHNKEFCKRLREFEEIEISRQRCRDHCIAKKNLASGEIYDIRYVWRNSAKDASLEENRRTNKKTFVKDRQTDNYASLILINGVQLVPRDKKNVNVHLEGTKCCTVHIVYTVYP